ncbi:response regulator [Chloroflexota bacterium]
MTTTKKYYIMLGNAMEELLSATQLAKYLNLKPVTVRRKAKRGEIPSIRVGNRLRFDKMQVDKWLAQRVKTGPVNILIVDDEPSIGQLFYSSLESDIYQVTTTLSSIDALELVGNQQFDIIFLDLFMPELDGAELFRRIRQRDKDVPVAIITGYPDTDMMARAMENGPFTVMKKPFSNTDIINVVNSYLYIGEPGSGA